MDNITREEILKISQRTFGVRKRDSDSGWTICSIEDLEFFTEEISKIIQQHCAEVAYEYLDDPVLSGQGYATGCYNAILNK